VAGVVGARLVERERDPGPAPASWLEREARRAYHPMAELFPLLEGEEFEELKRDIAAHGLREAIWLHPDGRILDGRNRHRACLETGTKPQYRTWDRNGSTLHFVVSLNLHRRHLTSSQRAVVSLDALALFEKEAKERQGQRTDLTSVKDLTEVAALRAAQQAAKAFDTNRQYISDAKRLRDQAPDLLDEVRQGNLTIPRARRELVRRSKVTAPPLPSAKYRVLYADPPWQYRDHGVIGETDNYGHAQRHYPTLSIAELCALGDDLKGLTEENAVLFLWVTSPLLEECFRVVAAWGFTYKASFVWDKVGHNYGHYNSVRHELLLVCTRGSCTPDNGVLHDSVVSIPKSGRHSEKPAYFRALIDELYPQGRRIELFARAEADGWDSWGNEPGDGQGRSRQSG
jgi:N6-adenosine-specific RNA methylase IME4